MAEQPLQEWLQAQVAEFARLRPSYRQYAALLRQVLGEAAAAHAPLAILQTRSKAVPSFAEKCLRKHPKYRMPAHQLTDLCGARLIARTAGEVRALSSFIEGHFDVDWENTIDASERLRWSEFGYRSIHYVVSLRPAVDLSTAVDEGIYGFTCDAPGCPGHGTFHPLKAEIQVRTMAEHAWADFAHDLTYKGAFELPDHWRREIALGAAGLEEVDRTFERIEEGLRTYAASYGSYLGAEALRAEIEILEMVAGYDPENAGLAWRIGKLAMSAGDWDRAVGVMERFVPPDRPEAAHQPLLRDLGVSLAKRRRQQDDLERGRRYLEAAAALDPGDADALASLAGTWRGIDDERARALYRQALEADPTDYYPLLNYVDHEIERTGTTDILTVLRPLSERAMARCRAHAELGLNIPWALYSLAKLHLLLGSPFEALSWYSLAIRASTAAWTIPTLDRTAAVAGQIEGHEWARRLLVLARAARFDDPAALAEVRALATPGARPIAGPVVLVAGGTDPRFTTQIDGFRPILGEALAGFRGTVISGGTRQGVCGMVGEFAEQTGGRVHAIGYLPSTLPADADRDDRYHEIRLTPGSGFSPLEPLQNWIDMVASGIAPAEVTVIGIGGGQIAALEYRIALALGASVGIVEGTGREASRLLADERWLPAEDLASLPADPHTVRAFLATPPEGLGGEAREALARELHRLYLEQVAQAQSDDPARRQWDELPDDLRRSNLAHAGAIVGKVEAIGCTVQLAPGKPHPVRLTDDEVEYLAEMEHGRWNAERLRAGWRWGPERDVQRRLSPYLVPWAELPEEIREHDRVFARRIPDLLARVGLEIVRTD